MESNIYKYYTTIINRLSCTWQEGYRVNQPNVLMEEILHHLRSIRPCKQWDFNYLSLNWWFPDFWTINLWEMVGVFPLSPCRHAELSRWICVWNVHDDCDWIGGLHPLEKWRAWTNGTQSHGGGWFQPSIWTGYSWRRQNKSISFHGWLINQELVVEVSTLKNQCPASLFQPIWNISQGEYRGESFGEKWNSGCSSPALALINNFWSQEEGCRKELTFSWRSSKTHQWMCFIKKTTSIFYLILLMDQKSQTTTWHV